MRVLLVGIAVSLSLWTVAASAGERVVQRSAGMVNAPKAGVQPKRIVSPGRPVAHTDRGNAAIARAYAQRKSSVRAGSLSTGACMPEEDDPLCDPWQEPEVDFVEFGGFEYVDNSGVEREADFALETVVVNGERPQCAVAINGIWMDLENCSLSSTVPSGPLADFSPASKGVLEIIVDKIVNTDIKLKRCVRIMAPVTLDFDASVEYEIALGNFLTVYQGETSNIYVATVDVKYPTGSTQTFYVLRNWRGGHYLTAPTPARSGNTCD